jgi:DNA-directed RNA polymerase specialized sigma24 family protein
MRTDDNAALQSDDLALRVDAPALRSDDRALQAFVEARYPRLRRTAFLMCGDWSVAGQVTQATLARLVSDSRRADLADPDAYAWADLMQTLQHRPGRREHVFVAAPDTAGSDPDTVLLLDALHRLTPRCRAVLVLRYWDGLGIDETADVLDLSDERVQAYEAAGLGALDVLLAEPVAAP